MNLEFFFSKTNHHTKAEELSLSFYCTLYIYIYIYIYIYTNPISTSIHGTRKKQTTPPPRQEQEMKVSRITAPGKKKKF